MISNTSRSWAPDFTSVTSLHVLHVSALVFSGFLQQSKDGTTKEFSVNEIHDIAAVTPPFMKTVQAEESCMRLFLLHSNVSA